MRIILFTNHFFPESFRCNDIAFELVQRGHSVKVLSSIPDYPEGKFYPGYSLFKRRIDTIYGVEVIRVPIIPRGNGKAFRLSINYISGIVFFFFYGLFQTIFHKYDCVLVHDTSPAFISLPAIRLGKLQKIPVYHWVLDMWPESLTAGGVHNKSLYRVITKMMKRIYQNDSKILITSHGFKQLLLERGVDDEKIEYLPNWSDNAIENSGHFELPDLPEGFIIMFAGNMGEAQNLENVFETTKLTSSNKDIHWVFVGDGRKKSWAENFVKVNNLSDTVHLLGRFPIETMSYFFSKADVMLVSLSNDDIFNLTLPAKVQAYMAAGKPILGMINGEAQDVIRDANCGWSCGADDINGMAKKVQEIYQMPKNEINKLGENSHAYYIANFTKNHCIDILENCILS